MEQSFTRKGEPLRNFTIALSQAQAELQAQQLAVLQHPSRQRIIKLLEKYNDRRLCVFEIAEVLEISYSAGVCPVPDKMVLPHLACSTIELLVRKEKQKEHMFSSGAFHCIQFPFPCVASR